MTKNNPSSKRIALLQEQWDHIRNKNLKLKDFTFGSGVKVWWKCSISDDHIWETSIIKRMEGNDCPFCAGRLIAKSNSLSTTNSEIAKQWHPTRNGKLLPDHVYKGSHKKVWWLCDRNKFHEWESAINTRVLGSNCPICAGKKVDNTNSLNITHPHIAKQWHPTKNGNLQPNNFTFGSSKKVWWKCDKYKDHEWEASINKRVNGRNCSICSGKKVVASNSLLETHPEIAKQWHYKNNGSLKPTNLTAGSNKIVWWKCLKYKNHEWQASVINRTKKKQGCPICSNHKIIDSNCLSATNPEIAKQWHPIKNGKLTPFKVSAGSSKKVWWKCDKNENHEWEALIKSRVNGSNCPICQNRKTEISNCLITTNPEIAKQWHPTKNGTLTPNDVTAGSKKKIWWTCDKGPDHIWRAALEKRLKGSDCPACSGKKTVLSNCLATTNPEIAQQWHPTKNGKLTPFDFTSGSGMKVWWKCPIGDDHEWESVILNRKQGNGCPICSNKAVVDSNCLAKTNPIIAQQWHPTKNGLLTPYHFVSNSNVKVWWKCDKGDDHEWESLISNRVKGKGCPVCSGRKAVLSNCLATLNPEIAKQWHPTKNVDLTPYDVKVQSNIKVWWLCNKNDTHEWKTLVGVRFRGSGCPYCVLTPQSRQELTITFELIQFFEDINPKGLKLKVKNKIWSIDIFIPELNLGIEFDGSFWHKEKQEFDLLKTSELHKLGYNIIRVREAPLTKITDNDIITKQPFNGKTITNEILKQITKLYLLDNTKLKQINKYLTKNDLQNENELDDYIERILIEKAELDKQKRKYRSTT